MRPLRVTVPAMAASFLLLFVDSARAASPADLHDAIGRAAATAGGPLTVSRRRATGLATFVRRADRGDLHPAFRGARAGLDKAGDFLARHGDLFGIADPTTETVRAPDRHDALGWTHERFRQTYQGLDVYGAAVAAHLAPDGSLRSVNGATAAVPEALATTPTVPRADAEQIATTRAQGPPVDAVDTHLVIYPRGLVRGTEEDPRLAWAITLASTDGTDRELVMVDALDGRVLERVDLTPDALSRQISEHTFDDVVWSEGDPDPVPAGWASGTAAQVQGWQDELDGQRESYDFHGSLSGGAYLSFDGADALMMTIHEAGIPCPNADWDGRTTNFCAGVTADDAVGHEWGHAYTQYTADFFYAWQPGALNESYSDVWGETIDLLNGRGTDTPGGLRASDGSACSTFGDFHQHPATDASYRWLIGEDAPAFGSPIRDMWQPECRSHPGRVGSSLYRCDATSDGGGVHSNSGVPNHLYALLVDGGTSNGVTVPGIGLVKAANILWRALSAYETSLTDFADHADALEASCADLIGVPLALPVVTPPATWTTAAEQIDAADCTAVAAAIAAVELRAAPPCASGTILQPDAPALCIGLGSTEAVATYDFEASLAPWTTGSYAVADPAAYTETWTRTTTAPDGHPGATAFASDGFPTDCSVDQMTGVAFLESPIFTVPDDRRTLHVAFAHWVATDPGFDGGNVKVSVNDGDFQVVPSDHFIFNPYNVTIAAGTNTGITNTNPLAGQPAWSGTDTSSVGGSWGESQIDLDGIAAHGDTVRLRFEFGRNRCGGQIGWYVDDVSVYSCSADLPACPDAPRSDCKEAPSGHSRLSIKFDPSNGTRERMQWSWSGGAATTLAELGDPRTATRYGLCIWDDRAGVPTLVGDLQIPSGSRWKPSARGPRYTDKHGTVGGLSGITLRAGVDAKASVALQWKGFSLAAALPPPASPAARFAADPNVTVQLVASTGACWTSTFSAADFRLDTIAKTSAAHGGP